MDVRLSTPQAESVSRWTLRRPYPGLLVSVRSVAEAEAVAHLEIDLLDLKEPRDGPLAPAAIGIWEQVADRYAASFSLSAALGELDQALDLAAYVPPTFAFAKAGPARCGSLRNLSQSWTRLREQLTGDVHLVAVAYADYRAADCPPPCEIFELAGAMGFKHWLIDTFAKDGRSALDHLTSQTLQSIARLAVSCTACWVLAGSIRLEMIPSIHASHALPDLFGVRGDVCDGLRNGEISPVKVERWLTRLREFEHRRAGP